MKNVILIGMSGVGKSTVGVLLAKKLGFNFTDTDLLLSNKFKMPVSKILEKLGYDEFIAEEGKVGKSIDLEDFVVATGGSMVFSNTAMTHLKSQGVIVWLDEKSNELEKRIGKSIKERGIAMPRPMTVTEIYEYRKDFYTRYADIHVFRVTGDLTATADLIYEKLKNF